MLVKITLFLLASHVMAECGDNEYLNGNTCLSLTTCYPGEYVFKQPTPTSDRECAECWYTYTDHENAEFCRWYPAMMFGCARQADENKMLDASQNCSDLLPASPNPLPESLEPLTTNSFFFNNNFHANGSFNENITGEYISNQYFTQVVPVQDINGEYHLVQQCQMWQKIKNGTQNGNRDTPWYIPTMGYRDFFFDPEIFIPPFSTISENFFLGTKQNRTIQMLFYSYVLAQILADENPNYNFGDIIGNETIYRTKAESTATTFFKNFGLTLDNLEASQAEYKQAFNIDKLGIFCGCSVNNFFFVRGDFFTDDYVDVYNISKQKLRGGTSPNDVVCVNNDLINNNLLGNIPFNVPESNLLKYASVSSVTTTPSSTSSTTPTTTLTKTPIVAPSTEEDDVATSTAAIIAFSVGGALVLGAVAFLIISSFYKKTPSNLF